MYEQIAHAAEIFANYVFCFSTSAVEDKEEGDLAQKAAEILDKNKCVTFLLLDVCSITINRRG